MSELQPATADGLVLEETISFWGGLDPATGAIIDPHHPQAGVTITGKVLVLPATRGSTSSGSSLLEALRSGHGPVAVVTRTPDVAITIACSLARRLYGLEVPYVVAGEDVYGRLHTGQRLAVGAGGVVVV